MSAKPNTEGIGMTSRRTRDRLIGRLLEQGIASIEVLDAIRAVPRHLFLDEALAHRAYEDTALPIGHGQTISQPYIVARMTEAIFRSGPLHKVLEVGTGCGYQTAVMARFAAEVYTVERIKPLLERARRTLRRRLDLSNIRFKHADGGMGWPEQGPFDAIITTAAPPAVPEELLQQLKDGGRLVIPVGKEWHPQELRLITRHKDDYSTKLLDPVRFVPLVSGTAE